MADAGTTPTQSTPAAPAQSGTPAATPATPAPAGTEAGTGSGETPAPFTPPPADSTQLETPAWYSSFSPESQEILKKNNWKDPNEVIKSYAELRGKISEKGILQPAPDAPKAEWDAYHKALGRPDKAADYTFTLPKEAPPDLPYDVAFADAFKNWAHENGLTRIQANALHDKYVMHATGAVRAEIAQINERIKSSHEELIKSWGQPGTESYAKQVEMATRAMKNLDPGLQAALKEAKLMMPDGTILSASVAKALAKVGAEIYAEDSLYGANALTQQVNPWMKGKENLTKQGEIFNTDPARARELARAAGVKVNF
jgi:hypothetical protein